jgi:hypothetical protein
MRLSTDIIAYSLRRQQQAVAHRVGEQTLCYTAPAIYMGQTIGEGECYICLYDAAPPSGEATRDCLLVFCGVEQPPEGLGCDTICLPDTVAVSSALNEVQAVFAYYQNWSDRLDELLWSDDEDSIQQMLDISAPIFENRLSLVDASFYVIGWAQDSNRPLLNERLADNTPRQAIPADTIRRFYELFLEVRDNRAVFYDFNAETQETYLCISLLDGDVYQGSLSIAPAHRRIERHDETLLRHLSQYMQRKLSYIKIKHTDTFFQFFRLQDSFTLLLQKKESDASPIQTTLLPLAKEKSGNLQKREIDALRIQRLLANIGFQPEDHFVCLAARIPTRSRGELADYLGKKLMHNNVGVVVQTDQNTLAIIINTDASARRESDMTKLLLTELANLGLLSGVSRQFCDFLQCHRHYTEARLALELLESDRGAHSFLLFEDCLLRLAVRQSCGQLSPEQLYNDDFRRLLAHDESSATSYVDTLNVWLEEGCNTLRSAKRLYLQRNSLLSRLERIRKLIENDLNDPDIRFYLQLCIRLRREFSPRA